MKKFLKTIPFVNLQNILMIEIVSHELSIIFNQSEYNATEVLVNQTFDSIKGEVKLIYLILKDPLILIIDN